MIETGWAQTRGGGKVLREADLAGMRFAIEKLCGIDEAGRGPLVGPVCAAAVILPSDFPFDVLDDSKALSPRKRKLAYGLIVDRALAWAVGWATCGEIGEINILNASLLAMKRAYDTLRTRPEVVLVDGNIAPRLDCRDVFPVVKGDALVPAIMAASIMAKVARDSVMERLDRVEPCYGFARHKGYPTAEHRCAIREHGLSQWARPGFNVGG